MASVNKFTTWQPALQAGWQKRTEPLAQAFNRLGKRDQLALLALLAFLLMFGVGFGGWALHKKANASQKAYDTTLADIFWLRSQAGNINPNQAQTANKADTVRQVLTQSGITAQVVENQDTIQVSFSHTQASVVSNVFSQLVQQGLTINQLQITQPTPDKLEVQAVLASQ